MTVLSVSHTSRAATGHWPVLLPALGIHITAGAGRSPARSAAAKTAFALTTCRDAAHGFATSAAVATA